MSPELAAEIGRRAILTAAYICLPPLVVGLIVGLLIGIFQAITQIHEMTLTFVPKIIAVGAIIYFLFPWMLKIIVHYTWTLYSGISLFMK
ncbi:flagellar biosynthetic protein FliQ [Candidatus Aerophobetes bacterium]|uniref:Flagellar biosynthetic protein FliQ n=1 Tax=Aerophobetes bacterium TaxID=2030807 RepID=A0A662DET9_UNCAE|nr:MAG: flagellar biosynthetic protein FliQ [Candidatus Aerophobetes bacterium]